MYSTLPPALLDEAVAGATSQFLGGPGHFHQKHIRFAPDFKRFNFSSDVGGAVRPTMFTVLPATSYSGPSPVKTPLLSVFKDFPSGRMSIVGSSDENVCCTLSARTTPLQTPVSQLAMGAAVIEGDHVLVPYRPSSLVMNSVGNIFISKTTPTPPQKLNCAPPRTLVPPGLHLGLHLSGLDLHCCYKVLYKHRLDGAGNPIHSIGFNTGI